MGKHACVNWRRFYEPPIDGFVKSLFLTTEGTETTEKSFLLQVVTSSVSVPSVVNLYFFAFITNLLLQNKLKLKLTFSKMLEDIF